VIIDYTGKYLAILMRAKHTSHEPTILLPLGRTEQIPNRKVQEYPQQIDP
jgi:hypothetical protein